METYVFQRGEDIAVPIAARGKTTADLAGVTVTAVLKKAVGGTTAPGPEAPVLATFDAEPRDDLVGVGAGWLLSIPAEACALLTPGKYATNATATIAGGGGTIKSPVLIIQIEPAT